MPSTSSDPKHPSPLAPDFSGRDRVLLYTRGMNLSPAHGVALALRSMRRAGDYAPAAMVMRELFTIFQENETPLRLVDEEGRAFVSAPPMNRTNMIAEDMEQFSITAALKKRVIALVNKLRGKERT